MEPTIFLVREECEQQVLAWLHEQFGKPDVLRWKYFRGWHSLKIKIMNKEPALLFVLACSEYLR